MGLFCLLFFAMVLAVLICCFEFNLKGRRNDGFVNTEKARFVGHRSSNLELSRDVSKLIWLYGRTNVEQEMKRTTIFRIGE